MAKRTQRTKPAPIDNRAPLTDAVCEYMHAHHRDLSIDALLASPCDALLMGIYIATQLGMLTNTGRAQDIAMRCARYRTQTPQDIAAIHKVLRAALSARKRGELRTDRY